ncbi:MAG: hypothetical protein ACU84Q_19970 [Gammaproteobacteria bacterium]
MAFTVEIDPTRLLVISRWEGEVNETRLRQYVDDAWTDPERRGYNELIDFSGVTEVNASFETIQAMAEYSRQFDNPDDSARTALIAPTDLIFGLSRMFASLRTSDEAENREFAVFESEHQALSWLAE